MSAIPEAEFDESKSMEEFLSSYFASTKHLGRSVLRDIQDSARLMSRRQARYLVDTYYEVQEYRKAAANQQRALEKAGEPAGAMGWVVDAMERVEAFVRYNLDSYSAASPLGAWARSQVGIGPVIAAGLLAHVDVRECPTAGHVWRFAGLDPSVRWVGSEKAEEIMRNVVGAKTDTLSVAQVLQVAEALNLTPERFLHHASELDEQGEPTGEYTWDSVHAAASKRPWNARLKVLCWKIGDSFCKVHNKPDAFYGHLYAERKEYEVRRNEAGDNANLAKQILREKKIRRSTEAYKYLSRGLLPPGQIEARARRWAVKLFLAHYVEVGRKLEGLPVVAPYPIAHLGHAHKIDPPGA